MSDRFNPTRIVVHCTATREGAWYDAADIDRWHRERGWSGIGYHAVVLLDGRVEPGRSEHSPGAHVAGHNADSLAVVYVGGLAADGRTPSDTRTQAQQAALLSVVQGWQRQYGIPSERVFGHYELDPKKACPSFAMPAFRAKLAEPAAPTGERLSVAGLPWLRPRSESVIHEQVQFIQRAVGVPADGVLGPQTYLAIARALAVEAAA